MTGDEFCMSLFELRETKLCCPSSSCVQWDGGNTQSKMSVKNHTAASAGRQSVHSLSASFNPIWAPTLATLVDLRLSTSIRSCSFSTMAICLWVRCSSTSASRRFTWAFNSVTHLWAWDNREQQEKMSHFCLPDNQCCCIFKHSWHQDVSPTSLLMSWSSGLSTSSSLFRMSFSVSLCSREASGAPLWLSK